MTKARKKTRNTSVVHLKNVKSMKKNGVDSRKATSIETKTHKQVVIVPLLYQEW